ncbi:MAG: flagellar biosynthetic protein FliR [Burkholderiaceae bacterium]|jgi:flagellar biosynthetic protein FliR|nr:flagellar biosynthetic protein FliR [Burkholderiaceae bacterium]
MITFSEAQIMAWLTPLLWPFLRVLAVFTAAPIFSSRSFPVRARILLALLVALSAQATLPPMPVIDLNGPAVLGVVIQQVGIGLAIGFVVRVVFAAFELAGEVVGFQMGLNFAAFFDPALNNQSSAVARFFAYMASLLFVVLNGHLLVLMAVTRSFEVFPVTQNFLEALRLMQLYTLGTELFASALWIALPMLALLLFTNLALGIISRVAPQMNVFAIGFPVTLAVGLVGLTATLPMLDQPFQSLLERSIEIFMGR